MIVDRRAACFGIAAAAFGGGAFAETALDAEKIVGAAAQAVRANYVDPGKADALAGQMLQRLEAGAYQTQNPEELAARLTADLREWTDDLHMDVFYAPPTPQPIQDKSKLTEDEDHPRTTGWGVQTVARLAGNVGLWRLTHFPSPPHWVAHKYAAAMELLSDTSALIIDLSINHGGGEDTCAFFLSYFFDCKTELGRVKFRGRPEEISTTTSTAPGPRYGEGRPIFVAISGQTFSAGEAVAWQLKRLRGATLVGERTKGGANLGDVFDLPDNFKIFIVTGRSMEPTWEGTGVAPDIEVTPARSVATAHELALKALMSGENTELRAQILRNVEAGSIENLSSFDFDTFKRKR